MFLPFFGLEGQDWAKIRADVKRIIDCEDKSKPLSDEAIVEELANAGIDVARHTVTKIRKDLYIPNAYGRRDWPRGKE